MTGGGTLYVVGTPIGNLEDLTYRAARILGEVALIAAEDTRAARVLLDHYGIRTRLVSCFEGNEAARAEELVARVVGGERVAVISQAGMPLVSDPGGRVVARAVAAGARVEVVPGPSAPVAALALAGLPAERFSFQGFLPRGEGERRAALGRLRAAPETLIFFEAPGRAARTLADLADVLGGTRRAALARELTKLHEEVARGSLAELAARAAAAAPRGEVTLVVEGAPAGDAPEQVDLRAAVLEALRAGRGPREIAAELSARTGVGRRALYQLALALRREAG